MKQYLSIAMMLASLFCLKNGYAQETDTSTVKDTVIRHATSVSVKDTVHYGPVTIISNDGHNTTVNIGKGKERNPKNVELDWLGFDFGWTNYADRSHYGTAEVNDFAPAKAGGPEASKGEFSLRSGKSVNVNIWPLLLKVNLVKHYLGLKTGIGIEMNNYRYSKDITYVNDVSKTYVIQDSIHFRKDKLFTEYLTIPVLLTFESNPRRYGHSFHFAAGPTFGYLVKSRTKQVSSARGKVKHNDPFNLENFRTALRTEVGYGPITLYGAYSLTTIHQYGLKQYPFSIGIELLR